MARTDSNSNPPVLYLTRRATFCASHRLHATGLGDSENQKLFGKCNHANGHGHNYVLEVTLKVPIDSRTGLTMNLVELKRVIEASVLEKVDHKHLNLDVPEFKSLNPTTENVAVVAWNWLQAALPKGTLHEIKIRETENNFVTYRGETLEETK